MNDDNIHIIQEKGMGIAFRKSDMRFVLFPMGEPLPHNGWGNDLTSQPQETLGRFLFKQSSDPEPSGKCGLSPSQPQFKHQQYERPPLDRLTLTVANACNLRCTYCYAAGGSYYRKSRLLMTRETVFGALNWAARAFSCVRHINFFGGEPTLNPDIIELACGYVRYLYEKRVLSQMPHFGITTNGYVLSERVLGLLTQNQFSVTLSLDGPKEIHDLKRRTISGNGTYDHVARNARRLQNHGLNVEFESTYTADHLRMGLKLTSLMDFFYEEFKSHSLHCPIVSARPGTREFISINRCLELQGDAIEYSIRNLARGIPSALSLAVRLLSSLATSTPIRNYCPAGKAEVTVNADGNVYLCFMFMQREACRLGKVSETPALPSGNAFCNVAHQSRKGSACEVIERFVADADKYSNDSCRRCWAQPLCYGCLGEDFERYDGRVSRSEVPGVSHFCDYKRALVDRFLRSVALVYLKPPQSDSR